MRLRDTLPATVILASLASPAGVAAATQSTDEAAAVEVLHFWVSAGERHALSAYAEAFEAGGGQWIDEAAENMVALRELAVGRIADGFPPTALQWSAGRSIDFLIDLDIANPVDRVFDTSRVVPQLWAPVAEEVVRDGTMTVVPVGVHGNNWSWYSAPIYRELGLPYPDSFAELLVQAELIRDAGYQVLAVGAGHWEQALLFQAIVLDVGGRSLYRALRNEPGALTAAHRTQLSEVMALFLALRAHVADPEAFPGWSAATQSVIAGETAVQIMGDWAHGEFLAVEASRGEDYECRMAPGNDASYVTVMDVFALARTDDPDELEAQRQFTETVLDPLNQVEFAARKGALPVRADIDPSLLTPCGQVGWDTLSRPGSAILTMQSGMSFPTEQRFNDVMGMIWRTPDMPPGEAVRALLTALSPSGGQEP